MATAVNRKPETAKKTTTHEEDTKIPLKELKKAPNIGEVRSTKRPYEIW